MTTRTLLALLIFSLSGYAQQKDKACEANLKKTPYFIRHGLYDTNDSLQLDFDILKKCGDLDSVDNVLLLNGPWIGSIMMYRLYMNNQTVTYDTVLKYIDLFKKTRQYAEFRGGFIASTQLTQNQNKKDAFFEKYLNMNGVPTPSTPDKIEFAKLDNIKTATRIAEKNGKRVLLYFSNHTSANAREFESKILTYNPIKRLMADNLSCFIAYTDDESLDNKSKSTLGKKFAKLQSDKFRTDYQPYLCIIDHDGKVLSEIGYTHLTEEFIAFLYKGLE